MHISTSCLANGARCWFSFSPCYQSSGQHCWYWIDWSGGGEGGAKKKKIELWQAWAKQSQHDQSCWVEGTLIGEGVWRTVCSVVKQITSTQSTPRCSSRDGLGVLLKIINHKPVRIASYSHAATLQRSRCIRYCFMIKQELFISLVIVLLPEVLRNMATSAEKHVSEREAWSSLCIVIKLTREQPPFSITLTISIYCLPTCT